MTEERFTANLRSAGRQLAQGLLQLVYPATCFACEQALPADEQAHFCTACRSDLTTDPFPCCPRCAGTVGPYVALADGCTACREQSFHFECAVRMGPYTGRLREVILKMKHLSNEGLAEVLGELWACHMDKRLQELKADVIVPVPLYWWRRWTRGYNQSAVLAQALAHQLRIPCRARWLQRVENTPRQALQTSATARRANMRNAFYAAARPELRGKTVLLVDDVLTTGSTANDAARALCAAGAARVVVAVLAGSHR